MANRKSVRGLSVYAQSIRRLKTFRISHPVPDSTKELAMLGFHGKPAPGDRILPGSMGRHTSFNANGRNVIRKDLPKVPESYMSWRTWKDWHGNPHSGVQHRTIDVYQRQHIPAPFEYLTVVENRGNLFLSSRLLSVDEHTEEEIVHLLNVFLEIFHSLSIFSEDWHDDSKLRIRKLHWKILPQGDYPFERAKPALKSFLEALDDSTRIVVEHRIEHITQHNPDFVAIGTGGFSDYVVFGFKGRNQYVFESPNLGNATYVFRDDWEKISQFSKKQILDGDMQEARIVHNHSWTRTIRNALT